MDYFKKTKRNHDKSNSVIRGNDGFNQKLEKAKPSSSQSSQLPSSWFSNDSTSDFAPDNYSGRRYVSYRPSRLISTKFILLFIGLGGIVICGFLAVRFSLFNLQPTLPQTDSLTLSSSIEGELVLPTPTPHVEKTATMPPTPLFLQEDFSSNQYHWALGSDNNGKRQINNNELWLTANSAGADSSISTGLDKNFSNFVIEVDTRPLASTSSPRYGLFFRKSGDSFYNFTLFDYSYRISKYDNGQWSDLVGETGFIAIRANAPNHLKIVAIGDQLEFFVNDFSLARVADSSFAEGTIGLMVTVYEPGQATVAFDNLVIRER